MTWLWRLAWRVPRSALGKLETWEGLMLSFKSKVWKNPMPQLEGVRVGGIVPFSEEGQPLCCIWVFGGLGDWGRQSA